MVYRWPNYRLPVISSKNKDATNIIKNIPSNELQISSKRIGVAKQLRVTLETVIYLGRIFCRKDGTVGAAHKVIELILGSFNRTHLTKRSGFAVLTSLVGNFYDRFGLEYRNKVTGIGKHVRGFNAGTSTTLTKSLREIL